MYGYSFSDDGEVIGQMPDGSALLFGSVSEYEDCFYDALFALNNCFEAELPEDAA